MSYYKLETLSNGSQNLIEAPVNIILEDGISILNFYQVADRYGWKELFIDAQPTYDNRYQELVISYEETETNIIQHYQVTETKSLDDFKQAKIQEFNNFCNQTIENGFISLGYHFSFGLPEDQMNFTQQLVDISIDNTITEITWKTEDAGVVVFTIDQFKQIIKDAKAHKLSNIQRYWEIKQEILNATTFEEVLNITW